ncbi:MAG: caspase family protein [Anaerolineae bacterium]
MTDNTNNRNKWALLIGIDKYAKLAARYQLNGCVNDVQLMAGILQDNFGFPEDNITLLRDEEATRDDILAAMDALVDRIGADDIVVIQYSGHGSQMRDREGDEPDGFDETIVPHDSGRGSDPNRDITDDEIYMRLLRLTETTPYVTLLFDCCHSGTIARDPFGANSRWVEPDERPIEELPPSPVTPEVVRAASRDLGPSGWLPLGQRYVLIAGCRDEESSYEHKASQGDGVITHGALTYFLSQELVRAGPGATYRDVFERASSQVTAAYSRQHPQMEGARDRELFGVHDIAPIRFVPVRQRAGDSVTLGAGAARGVTVGSQWAVYSQAVKQVTEETPRLGLVEIATVRAVTSDAQILEEEVAGIVMENTRAVEEAHSYGELRMVVAIQAPAGYEEAVTELAELIEASALLRQAEAGENADVRAYVVAPRTEVSEGDPMTQLGDVPQATWAVVGQDGRLMMPTHAVDEAGVAAVLRDNLEKAVRYRQALALRNPDDDSRLKGKVEFILKRQKRDGSWVKAEPEDDSGLIVFEEGERIAAEIVNRHSAPIYVSVLDFGLTGAVGLLHPVAGASEQLAPGKSIQIGVRAGDEVELYMPDNFPYVPDPNDEEPVAGTETFKLFATTHEADFSPLVQEGVRAARGAGTPLGQLLDMALTGHGTRDVRRNRVPPNEEWTTVERSFSLRRRAL